MPASSARAARPTSSWSTATRSAIPPRSGGCGDGSGATAEGSSLVRPVLLFADLLVAEAAPAHDAVAVGDHAGVAAEVDGAVAGAQAGLVRVLAQHVLDTAGLAGPVRVVPRTADRGRVGEPAALGVEGSQLLVVAQLLGPAGALDGPHPLTRGRLARPPPGWRRRRLRSRLTNGAIPVTVATNRWGWSITGASLRNSPLQRRRTSVVEPVSSACRGADSSPSGTRSMNSSISASSGSEAIE